MEALVNKVLKEMMDKFLKEVRKVEGKRCRALIYEAKDGYSTGLYAPVLMAAYNPVDTQVKIMCSFVDTVFLKPFKRDRFTTEIGSVYVEDWERFDPWFVDCQYNYRVEQPVTLETMQKMIESERQVIDLLFESRE